jgi:hypothetical protein
MKVKSMETEDEGIVGLHQRHGRAWASDRGNKLYERACLDRFLALVPVNCNILDHRERILRHRCGLFADTHRHVQRTPSRSELAC